MEKSNRDLILDEVNHLGETLLRKNSDYGDSVFSHPILYADVSPEAAVLVRLSDKFQRLVSLLHKKTSSPLCESTDDTLLDIAGYCVLLRVIRKQLAARMECEVTHD